ncbi:hypothetical protein H6B07_14735 [Mediterraneibacter glycyrrhizinilyticus]|nr:hypothetical protein [Mediterraneibacter glycyrrhizinilyticus]MBM6803890.1 hypothetical protein [Mediterraneibacter glycyrrhizinilyticus]
MTIKQFIKKYGWQMECTSKPGKAMSVDIDFVDSEGREDETQMDIKAYDTQELSQLFSDFCKENKFPQNTVTYIAVVQIADTMEELLYGQ